MPIELLFQLCTWGVLPFWLLLLIAPDTRLTERLVHSGAATLVFSVVHLVLVLTRRALTSRTNPA